MKVKELIKELKKLDQNAEVYTCLDWEDVTDGILNDLYKLEDVCKQVVTLDQGMDFEDRQEIILCFSDERA